MRMIPKATKVKFTFYKGITIPDVVIGMASLALIALTLASNFPWRIYAALGIFAFTIPLYITVTDRRLYMEIWYLLRYLFSRKRFKKGGSSDISTIIPYREVKEEFVYNKDSSIFGVIKINPINFSMFDEERQNLLIDGTLSRIFNSASLGEEFFLIKLDEPLILDDKISGELRRIENINNLKERGELTEKERERRINIIESRMGVIDELNSNEECYPSYYLALLGYDKNLVDEKLNDAISLLKTEGIDAKRLNEHELNCFIARGFGKDIDPRNDIDDFSSSKAVFKPFSSTIDSKQVTNLIISKYPMNVPNAWGERLFSLPDTKVMMRMKPVEKTKATRRVDNSILEIESREYGKESKQIESDYHLDSLHDLLEDISQGNETLFDTVAIISVYDNPRETTNKRAVKQTLREMGLGFSEMAGRQLDSFISSLISTKEMTGMTYGIQTSSVAAMFPFVSDERVDPKGILLGENDKPCFINFFKRDQMHVNSNTVIIGQSGSGKSYATKTILSNLASDGNKVFILDPEAEYVSLAKNLGGVSLDASNGLKQRINPFEIISSYDEDGNISNSYFSHLQFLEQLFKVVLPGINNDALEMLNKLVDEVYKEKGIGPSNLISEIKSEDYPTFDDLYNLAKKKLSNAKDSYEESCLRIIVNYIARFASGGRDSSLWNGPTTIKIKENFIDFNFQKLIANKNDVTSNAEMLLLLRYLENEVIKNRDMNIMNHTDNKIVIAIDEAHLFIDEKYPIALDFMYSLAKRIRKYNGMLIIITQNIKDFTGTPDTARKTEAIINVSQYSLIFNLSPNDLNELVSLYKSSGSFNKEELDYIAHARRGECFMISSPSERGRLEIETTNYIEQGFND